jgi:DNA-binding transcriptional MocR family regulator
MNWLDLINAGEPGKDRGEPLYVQILNRMRDWIESGKLPENSKLPTNRELAGILNVDRSTIARAYSELSQLGMIDSHVGRGTFVRSAKAKSAAAITATGTISWNDRFSRSSQTAFDIMAKQAPPGPVTADMISFGGGLPTEEFYPHSQFEQIVKDVLESGDSHSMFEYSPAEGHTLLRREVLRHLQQEGIEASDDELLIVSGSQQAIDLVTNVFVDPGDTILLEDPSYFWAICNFRARQARCVPVTIDKHGVDLNSLENALATHRAKLIYLMPSFQNPTGATISLDRRLRILELAQQYSVPILEDNFVGDLRYDGEKLPTLRALPGGRNHVIHQGTFSKALCPGLRLGWLIAPPEVLSRLLLAKRVSDLSTNSMAQITLARYLSAGLYGDHLDKVRQAYKQRRDTMLGALNKWFHPLVQGHDPHWSKPEGGLFIWLTLPSGLSARELLRFAEKEGVTFSSGDLFFLTADRKEYVRLCFIQTAEPIIEEGIRRLSLAYEKYLQTLAPVGASKYGAMARTRDQVLI